MQNSESTQSGEEVWEAQPVIWNHMKAVCLNNGLFISLWHLKLLTSYARLLV